MLHCKITRPKDPSIIVFLHGAGTSSWMWDMVTADLPEYHCIAVDMPGHGASADQPWVSIDNTAAKVQEAIGDIPDETDVYVVGLSLGGYVGLQMLREMPDRFTGAILSGVHAGASPVSGFQRKITRLAAPLMKWSFFAKRSAAAMGITDTKGFAAEAKKTDTASAQLATEQVMDFEVPADLDVISTPTLFVAGTKEHPAILAGLSAFRDVNPAFKVATVDDLGHAWSAQDPALFAAMVRAVVTGADLPEGILDRDSIKLLEAPTATDAAQDDAEKTVEPTENVTEDVTENVTEDTDKTEEAAEETPKTDDVAEDASEDTMDEPVAETKEEASEEIKETVEEKTAA